MHTVTRKGNTTNKRNKIRSGCLTPKEGGNATSPRHSRGSPTPSTGAKSEVVPNKGEQHHKWLTQPCHLGGPKEGGNATPPLHSRGSPTKGKKIRSGCLTPAFSGAQKRAEMVHHPSILRDPQQRGRKSEVAASPLPSRGPKRGRKCYITPAFSGVPYRRGRKQKWPTKGQKCYITPTFSGVPKQGDKVKGGPQVGGSAT